MRDLVNFIIYIFSGKEHFMIGKANCCITVDASGGFAYEYVLEVSCPTRTSSIFI